MNWGYSYHRMHEYADETNIVDGDGRPYGTITHKENERVNINWLIDAGYQSDFTDITEAKAWIDSNAAHIFGGK